ncbi:DNA methyltransferase like protein [Termitomyces sp. J132]|nr:DNA methyltransferase like protein [Termitomyces sp. J132]
MPVRALEFFCGIGGLHLAFKRSGVDGSVVQAFDWDQTACQVYSTNFPQSTVQKVDIATLTAADLVPYNADFWLLSPACQPYTVLNPNANGASDPRAKSFLHLIQIVLPDMTSANNQPSHLLVENVAGFETSSTRQILLSVLQSLGYTTLELLITPLQFGIPNSRLRYYLLARFAHQFPHVPADTSGDNDKTSDDLLPTTSPVRKVQEYLDSDEILNNPHPNAVPDRVLIRWGRLFDIVLPSSQRTCCFTRGYSHLVERAGSILQMNENLDTTQTFDRFIKASLNHEECAVEILRPLRLRYFSPSELLRLFDFTPIHTHFVFVWPVGISAKTKYRLIGNSVNVSVVQKLISYLFLEM